MKKIKKILSLTAVFALMSGAVSAMSTSSSYANALQDGACDGVQTVLGGEGLVSGGAGACAAEGEADSQLANTVNSLINLFSIIVGAVSVVMIIYGGFKYMTSGGSDDGTKAAKNTILYALVGLVIVLLAQTIVKFVFGKALDIGGSAE
jgi:hypothetical protein